MDDDDLVLTESDRLRFMTGVTAKYSELSGIPLRDAARMFADNNVYGYLYRCADQCITKTYRYMARDVADWFGLPLNR